MKLASRKRAADVLALDDFMRDPLKFLGLDAISFEEAGGDKAIAFMEEHADDEITVTLDGQLAEDLTHFRGCYRLLRKGDAARYAEIWLLGLAHCNPSTAELLEGSEVPKDERDPELWDVWSLGMLGRAVLHLLDAKSGKTLNLAQDVHPKRTTLSFAVAPAVSAISSNPLDIVYAFEDWRLAVHERLPAIDPKRRKTNA